MPKVNNRKLHAIPRLLIVRSKIFSYYATILFIWIFVYSCDWLNWFMIYIHFDSFQYTDFWKLKFFYSSFIFVVEWLTCNLDQFNLFRNQIHILSMLLRGRRKIKENMFQNIHATWFSIFIEKDSVNEFIFSIILNGNCRCKNQSLLRSIRANRIWSEKYSGVRGNATSIFEYGISFGDNIPKLNGQYRGLRQFNGLNN